MKVLIVGGGGREHVLAWKLKKSPLVSEIFVTPGNGGMKGEFQSLSKEINNYQDLAKWALSQEIDLTVVGPEEPLVRGLVDTFLEKGLKVFGPTASGALLEGSKVFAKNLLAEEGIPTADFKVFDDPQKAISYVEGFKGPIVIKADGLAGGKGVFVAHNPKESKEAIKNLMIDQAFGEAGTRVLVEEFLEGQEASILAITDGDRIMTLEPSQDHKHISNGDTGENTGGMGAFSPTPVITSKLQDQIEERILYPTLKALQKRDIHYQGVLYVGLMLTSSGPKVLEYNCRFGDPEAQVVIPRIEGDLFPVLLKAAEGTLGDEEFQWDSQVALCVIMASSGYPRNYETGYPIYGLDTIATGDNLLIFHAGTTLEEGVLKTAGGRVLGVMAKGEDFVSAKKLAYQAVKRIEFANQYFRTDIGDKAIYYGGVKDA